jgi:hypothetical protein
LARPTSDDRTADRRTSAVNCPCCRLPQRRSYGGIADTSAQSDDKSSLLAGCLPPIRHLRDKGDRGQFAGQWIEDKLYPANVAAIYLL